MLWQRAEMHTVRQYACNITFEKSLFQQHNNLKADKRLSTFMSSWQENYFSENTYIYW